MPAGDWLNGWTAAEYIPASEMSKSVGCFYDNTLGVDAASVAVTLPTWAADLWFDIQVCSDASTPPMELDMRFNSDSSAVYDYAYRTIKAGGAEFDVQNDTKFFLMAAIGSAPDSGSGELVIPNYRGTTLNKRATFTGGAKYSTGATSSLAKIWSGSWNSAAALTSVTFIGTGANIAIGSRIRGYVSG